MVVYIVYQKSRDGKIEQRDVLEGYLRGGRIGNVVYVISAYNRSRVEV